MKEQELFPQDTNLELNTSNDEPKYSGYKKRILSPADTVLLLLATGINGNTAYLVDKYRASTISKAIDELKKSKLCGWDSDKQKLFLTYGGAMKMMCIYMKSSPFTRILVKRHLKDVIEFSDGSFPRLRKLCRQDYYFYDDKNRRNRKYSQEMNMKYNRKYGKNRKKIFRI